ncbi:MAG: NCS2 family permease [Deltaproteobacteria bacterium]|nr:NCS2 family permease [Deltaproteobacteria bacterium]
MKGFFNLRPHGTTARTEILAGITTFMTMAYILAVNPAILSTAGMPKDALFTATALASVAATLVMALYAKLPFALAPGMGLNAFFAFTVVLGMGHSWQTALTAVFLEGLLFILLSLVNLREAVIKSIPLNLKRALSVGIGLFIAFIGLQNAGIVVKNEATMVALGNVIKGPPLLALIGLALTGLFLALRLKGALLAGILATTAVGIPLGVTQLEGFRLLSLPASIGPIFLQFDFTKLLSGELVIVVFTFLLIDIFDTIGSLVGVCTKVGMLTPDGEVPQAKRALLADAIGTTFGAMIGTSTVTTYIESAAGVAEGGRTGLSSLATAGMFFLALFFSPLFLMVPAAATAPTLIIVGLFMLSPVKEIDLDDYTEAIPAFLAMIAMPLTYSIADGIIFGILSYTVLKVITGRAREVSLVTYGVAAFSLLKFI